MLKKLVPVLAASALLAITAVPSARAFEIGGAGGWQFSTDGIIDVFSVYQTVTPVPAGNRGFSLLGSSDSQEQSFGLRVGLLPSVVAFNVKAPTTNGVDSTVRIGIYPNIQNKGDNRFDTSPNIDFRELFYTAKGAYGELLAGRALNLYQGKNILTDMTLLTAGVVGNTALKGGTTLGHIGYGYLYTNFGPQIRYTTPDLNGVKVAFSVNEPYKISADTGKTNSPRLETEVSYTTTVNGYNVSTWASGLYESATRSKTAAARPGETNQSIGGAAGAQLGIGKVDLLASGYYGQALGMVSVQDGDFLGSTSTDGAGKERTHYGFLAQATYKLTPKVKLGLNYGQSCQEKSDFDKTGAVATVPIKRQESAVAMVTYNFNKFIQFIGEYTYAQNTWQDNAKQHANSLALGTMFYW
jgi:hypothetical protein